VPYSGSPGRATLKEKHASYAQRVNQKYKRESEDTVLTPSKSELGKSPLRSQIPVSCEKQKNWWKKKLKTAPVLLIRRGRVGKAKDFSRLRNKGSHLEIFRSDEWKGTQTFSMFARDPDKKKDTLTEVARLESDRRSTKGCGKNQREGDTERCHSQRIPQ